MEDGESLSRYYLLTFLVGWLFGHNNVFLWYVKKVLLYNKRAFGNAFPKAYSFFLAIWRLWYVRVQPFALPHHLVSILPFLFFMVKNKTDNSIVKPKRSSIHLLPLFLGYS